MTTRSRGPQPEAVAGRVSAGAHVRLAVGSANPVKLASVREAAALVFEGMAVDVSAVVVASGVPAQPIGDAQTMAGASQRARAALASLPGSDIGIGLEAGIADIDGRLFTYSWCAAVDQTGRIQHASAPRWELPAPVAALIHDGLELGDAIDRIYGRTNAKQHEGAVGIVTRGRLSRAHAQVPAVVLALAGLLWGEASA